jgi:hypothetical protein
MAVPPEPSALRRLDAQLAADPRGLDEAAHHAIAARIRDLVNALGVASAAIGHGDPNAASIVARSLVQCRWLTGISWRRTVIEPAPSYRAMQQVLGALHEDLAAFERVADRLFAARGATRGACAACGAAAASDCVGCGRGYCATHIAVEEEWSGSWLVDTHRTCPLGHDLAGD